MKSTESLEGAPSILHVRNGTVEDLPFIFEQESRADYRHLIFRWPEEKHRGHLTDPAKRYRVLEAHDGTRLGYAILGNLLGKRPLLIRLVAAMSGQGVGRTLLADAIDHVFNKTTAPALYLDVFPDNHRAITLYQKFGFKEAIRLRRVTTINGEERPLMVMVLERPK